MGSNSTDILTIVLIAGFIIVALGMMILWFAMLLDAFRHPNQQSTTWLIILICAGSFGGILYYIMVYKKRPATKNIKSEGEPQIPGNSYNLNENKIE